MLIHFGRAAHDDSENEDEAPKPREDSSAAHGPIIAEEGAMAQAK